ncbi:MAG TPA: hypothetical protein VH163_04315 [Gemmatimonadales bacterium]|nr:hypothetical protein [Gemmatimonadales bacterium]
MSAITRTGLIRIWRLTRVRGVRLGLVLLVLPVLLLALALLLLLPGS